MASIRLSSLIGSISGSLGPITFKNTRFGPLATSRLLRTKHRSPAQQASASRWVTIARAWDQLDTKHRTVWAHLAKQLTFTNHLGVTYRRSAFSVFTAHASPAYHARLTIPIVPPVHPALPELTNGSASFDVITGYGITVTLAGPLDPVYLLTFGSRPLTVPTIDYRSPGKYPPPYIFKKWRFLRINSHALGTSGEGLTSQFKAAWGDCQATEAVAVRAFLWHPLALASPVTLLSTFVSS